jgi:hypothetical protein
MAPEDIPGADWGDKASLSSRNGFVECGRSGRLLEETDPVTEGERARLRKGLLEPKLATVGETWCSFQMSAGEIGVSRRFEEECHLKSQGVLKSFFVSPSIRGVI